MNKGLLILVLAFVVNACVKDVVEPPVPVSELQYSFFTAGHTYGNPVTYQPGLHIPFVEYFDELNEVKRLELGFFTGDFVPHSEPQYFDSASLDIARIDVPVFIAAGNHDIGHEFVDRYGDYYYAFRRYEDLFLVLTPGLDNWNISGPQLDFVEKTLEIYAASSRHVFVMMHELIWWSPDSIFHGVKINWSGNYPGSSNFWSEVEPLFRELDNRVIFFAGDLGATSSVTSFMYHAYENVTLIASGMGGGVEDNIILTHLYDDGIIDFELVGLNQVDRGYLGELEDYQLPE